MTLDELCGSSDWGCVFGEGGYTSGCKSDVESIDGTPTDPVYRRDVVEIIAVWEEQGDYAAWSGVGVFRLADGRYLAADGWCDTTGWGCQDGNQLTVASSVASLIEQAITPDQCRRLGLSHPVNKESDDA